MKIQIPLLAAFLGILSCSSPSDAQENNAGTKITVFKEVNVISMDSEEIIRGMDVVIENGKIKSIAEPADHGENAQIIEGGDKYLIPGLAEMHAHIPTDEAGDLVEETLFLYLAGGVTTIRGMLGHPSHLKLRTAVETDSLLGPHITTSGPSINGNSAPDVETAANMVREQQAAGYDFLKLHPGLTLEVFDTIAAVAQEVGITYAGHVSRDVGIRHALKSNYATIDHLDGYLEGMVPEDAGVDPQENGFFGINFTDLVDESQLEELIALTKEHQVWMVPTQCLAERWAAPMPASELSSQAEMKYMPATTLDQWVNSKQQMQSGADYQEDKAQRFIDLRRRMIKSMYDAGVGVLLGSDAPQVFNVPGFSIWHELEMYVAAGLTPYQALLTGTVNPAEFLETDAHRGKIIEGYDADLVLLEGNPLEDITHGRQRAGVMIGGVWLSRAALEQRLGQLAQEYQNQ